VLDEEEGAVRIDHVERGVRESLARVALRHVIVRALRLRDRPLESRAGALVCHQRAEPRVRVGDDLTSHVGTVPTRVERARRPFPLQVADVTCTKGACGAPEEAHDAVPPCVTRGRAGDLEWDVQIAARLVRSGMVRGFVDGSRFIDQHAELYKQGMHLDAVYQQPSASGERGRVVVVRPGWCAFACVNKAKG